MVRSKPVGYWPGNMKIDGADNQPRKWPSRTRKYLAAITIALCLTSVSSRLLWGAQSVTRRRLDRVDWQPTQAIPGARYVGRAACAGCHPGEATEQESSAMALALQFPARSSVLQTHPRLTFSN